MGYQRMRILTEILQGVTDTSTGGVGRRLGHSQLEFACCLV